MATYLHPGVYLEELRGGPMPIQPVGTSTAAFIGFARQGPIGTPELVSRWDEYQAQFGGIFPGDPLDLMGHSVSAFFSNGGGSAYIVRLADGANKASKLLLDPNATDAANPAAADTVYAFSATSEGAWGNSIRIKLSTGETPASVTVQLYQPPAPNLRAVPVITETYKNVSLNQAATNFLGTQLLRSSLVSVEVQTAGDYMLGTSVSGEIAPSTDLTTLNGKGFVVTVNGTARPVVFSNTQFAGGTTLPVVAAQIQQQVTQGGASPAVTDFTASAQGEQLVLTSGAAASTSSVAVSAPTDATPDGSAILKLGTANGGTEQTGEQALEGITVAETAHETTAELDLAGGTDGQPASETDYQNVFSGFLKIRDINIICLPGMAWDANGNAAVQDAIAHAETARSRMVIVDPPDQTELKTASDVTGLSPSLSTSTYAALYYPWVTVPNPDYNAETNPTVPRTVNIPPSGFAAGMWAKIDAKRGVWKAPAGTETALLGLAGLEYLVEDAEQDGLNPLGVNCLRQLPGYGNVIWGARTLATNADPEWRYIPVRRTAMFIEGSIYNGIQWAVFEPNDDQLWAALRASITSFMDGLFRVGAFQGATATDAYFVRCGLGSTMTQGDIDAGQVIVLVGFAPLEPAEFVIVRIQQQVGQ